MGEAERSINAHNATVAPATEEASAARPTQTPARRHPPRALFLVANPLLKLLLRLPVPLPLGRDLLLLTFTGRKSGKRFTTPVGYYRLDNTLNVFTDSKWWRNLRSGTPVTLHVLGRAVQAVPEIVRDREEIVRTIQQIQRSEAPSKAKRLRFILGLDPEIAPSDADLHAALGAKNAEQLWLLIRLRPRQG